MLQTGKQNYFTSYSHNMGRLFYSSPVVLWIPVNVTQFIGAYFVTLTRMSH